LIGVLDVENAKGLLSIDARPAATNMIFAHVAHGNGLFTALALASGSNRASVTIEVYEAAGGTPRTATVTLEANQQQMRLISEFIPSLTCSSADTFASDRINDLGVVFGSTDAMGSGHRWRWRREFDPHPALRATLPRGEGMTKIVPPIGRGWR
jgi:hypothetical protein